MASRDYVQQIDFRQNEMNALVGIQNYLNQSKHSTIQKRTYTKPGEYHFYDVSALETTSGIGNTISLFRSGPKAQDFYFNLVQQGNRNYFQIFKSFEHPDNFVDVIRERVLYVGETAIERLENNKPHQINVPFGYSLWARDTSEKTPENFANSIKDGKFTEDFKNYCLPRNYRLVFRAKKN